MSAWKELVLGQGCGPSVDAASSSNPLSQLANGLLKSQEYGPGAASLETGIPNVEQAAAAGSRTRMLTRQLMPDADEPMVDAHAAALMQSLKLNQGIPELPVDDAKLHAFMRPPRTPSPPDTRSPSFAPRHSGLRPTSSPHQRASPLTGRPIAGIGNRMIDQQGHMGTTMDAMRQAWQDDMAELQLHDRMGLEGAPWVADFADRPRLQGHGHQAMPAESAWAAEFGGRLQLGQQSPSQGLPSGSDWARDFTSQLQLSHPGAHPAMDNMLSQQQQHLWAHQQRELYSQQQHQQQQLNSRPKSLSAAWNELFVHSAAASASSPPDQHQAAGGPAGRAVANGHAWGDAFHQQRLHQAAGAQSQAPASNDWSEEFQAANASRLPEADKWANDFQARLQLDGASESASWADSFQRQQQEPAGRGKARGTSPDDPLEDPTAASWVAQFNEQLHLTTTNAVQGEQERLCREVQMCPPGRNPFSQHPLPMQAARRLQQTGDLLQASLAFEAAALAAPGNADAWHALGNVRTELAQPRAAVPAFHQAALADGRGEGRLRCLADACITAGPSAGAEGIAAVQQWVALRVHPSGQHGATAEPPSAASPIQLHEALQGLGRETPGDARVWQVLAQLQALQGNDAAAADTFAHAFSLTSHQDTEMLLQLGAALSRMRQPGQSERCFSAAAKAAPGDARSWHGLAQAQSRQGKFQEAAGSYVQALALRPASADLWAGLGMALTASGEPELADMADARDLAQIQHFLSNRPLQSWSMAL